MIAVDEQHELRRYFRDRTRAPRLRSMQQFAEQELVIPDGQYKGLRFKAARQPYSSLWLREIDSGRWNIFASTGPTQSGKTLLCCILPVMYHLFEIEEPVIFGLPQMEMAADKWHEDILPAIEASQYRDFLPSGGAASRGGGVGRDGAIRFKNGTTLKFMSGGGSDKKRAAFTARVVVITEADGLDEMGGTSREATKIKQIEARTMSYWRGNNHRIYKECTVSIETGEIWQSWSNGSKSRIYIRCPHCKAYVSPEREHFSGWQDADSGEAAGRAAFFFCAECGEAWTDDDRTEANQDAVLVHRVQQVSKEGEIAGPHPDTATLGFRWSAVNNLFVSTANIGSSEWAASRSAHEEAEERKMRQFIWAIPIESQTADLAEIAASDITYRVAKHPRGVVPDGTQIVSVGLDIGQYLCHWVGLAWSPDGSPHAFDYGVLEGHRGISVLRKPLRLSCIHSRT